MSSNEWKLLSLKDVLDLKNGKSRPKDDGQIPVYGGNGILGYTNKSNVNGGTIIIGRVGAYCGATYFENRDIWISDNALYAKTLGENNTKFFYYLLKYKDLNQFAGGSTHPLLTQGSLNEIQLSVPNPDWQYKIASILSSLDEKIENNLNTNQTLEEIARTLFKEWFVNFNYPNADGRRKHSEMGEIPADWEVRKLGDILEIKGGTTPSTKNKTFWDGEYHWTTPRDLSSLQFPVLLDTQRKITEEGLKQISSGLLPKGTLLMSSRAPIGYLAIAQVPTAINQGFIAVNGKGVSNTFMLFWLIQNIEKVKSLGNGTTFLEISKTTFRNIEILIPDSNTLELFDKVVEPIFKKIITNELQTQTLKSIRDSLLPKLMSGKIDLNISNS